MALPYNQKDGEADPQFFVHFCNVYVTLNNSN